MEKTIKKDIKRIVLIGPESTGKTLLSEYLSDKFSTVFVPEYAREYITKLDRKYTYEHVENIANKQVELEKEYLKKAHNILFYDTFLIITKIWFKVVYSKIPEWIDEKIKKSNINLFLLCNTDIAWEPDGVRENGGQMREKLFDMYKTELISYGFKYKIVSGTGQQRIENALNIVHNYLQNIE